MEAPVGLHEALGVLDEDQMARIRNEVVREASHSQSTVEDAAIRLLDIQQREAVWLKQERANILALLERTQKENAELRSRLAVSPQASVQAALDTGVLATRLTTRDADQAKAVVDFIRQVHTLEIDGRAYGLPQAVELQLVEGKRNLNRAMRCLLMENQSDVGRCIADVARTVDRHEYPPGTDPGFQMVFIEGESLIFRIMSMRLQPRDIYDICSLADECPRGTGGWGLKSLFAVSDTPVIVSLPFQVRLDAASRGPHGLLCPEWVASLDATDATGELIVPASYHARIKENSTFIYARLRESAKVLVRSSDMESFDGLSLAFMEKLKKVDMMLVSYEGPAEVKVVRTMQHEAEVGPVMLEEGAAKSAAAIRRLQDSVHLVAHRAFDCCVRLHKGVRVPDRNYEHRADAVERWYRLHEFRVALDDKETTVVALAFPLDSEKRPLLKDKRKKENGGSLHTECIYCRTTVPKAGKLPFALNGDFDLTSDMEGLHPTSAWNHWLLSCAARLFVVSFLTDPLLRNYVDHYVPERERVPEQCVWTGVVDAIEGLIQTHMFVKTESDLLVPRLQAVLRPAAIPRDFISDHILREVTSERRHFVGDVPRRMETGEDAVQDDMRVCPMEPLLLCVEKLAEVNQLDERGLGHVWAYLASELTTARGQEALKEVRPLLTERLAIFPIEGRSELRRFTEDGIAVFSSVSPTLQPTLRDTEAGTLFAPVLDLARLLQAAPHVPVEQIHDVLRALGAKEATAFELKRVIKGAFDRELTTFLDPDRFWMVHTFVTKGLGFPNLRAFLGQSASLCVSVLEPGGDDSGGKLVPRLVRVENGKHGRLSRIVLPTFVGVIVGTTEQALTTVACVNGGADRQGDGRGGVVPLPSSVREWATAVRWEAVMKGEVGLDGGSNRDWKAMCKVLSPQTLLFKVLEGLEDSSTSGEARRDFSALLSNYLQDYPQFFSDLRAAHRVPNTEVLQLVQHPNYEITQRGALLRFSPSFFEGCLHLITDTTTAPQLTLKDLRSVLPMVEGAVTPEAVAFQDATGLGLASLDSLYAVSVAMHVITHRLQARKDLVMTDATQGGGAARTLRTGAGAWDELLLALFRRAVKVVVETNGMTITDDRKLLEAYCRSVGLWLKLDGEPRCLPIGAVVWSAESDPIVGYVAKTPEAGVAVLIKDETVGALGEPAKEFFVDILGVSGQQLRQRVMFMLLQGLTRWAEHKGPMPRDVEDMYRAVCAAAEAAWGQGEGGVKGRLGLDEIPVVTLAFELKTLGVTRDGLSADGQPLVGVAGKGEPDDGGLSWFYREMFPSRSLHPSIFSLLKLCSPALIQRLNLSPLRLTFSASYADATGSVVSTLKAMNVDLVRIVSIVCELYGEEKLSLTEVPRFWANVSELRDAVLPELWRPDSDPAPRNEELIEALRNHLALPLSPSGSATNEEKSNWEMVIPSRGSVRVYMGSIVGIDTELHDKQDAPRVVKHPKTSKDSIWHRQPRPEDGWADVEQSCYWERFLLALDVKPLEEKHLQLIPLGVLNKVFLALAKFNGLLNGPDQTVASQYNIWSSYHHIYRAIDGNMYVSRYKELARTSSQQQGISAPPPVPVTPVASAAYASGPQAPPSILRTHSHGYYDYTAQYPANPPSYSISSHSGSYSMGSHAGYVGQPHSQHHGHQVPSVSPTAADATAHCTGVLAPPAKRVRSMTGDGMDGEAHAKVPRLMPPTPTPTVKASSKATEEGEIEEGEIHG